MIHREGAINVNTKYFIPGGCNGRSYKWEYRFLVIPNHKAISICLVFVVLCWKKLLFGEIEERIDGRRKPITCQLFWGRAVFLQSTRAMNCSSMKHKTGMPVSDSIELHKGDRSRFIRIYAYINRNWPLSAKIFSKPHLNPCCVILHAEFEICLNQRIFAPYCLFRLSGTHL